MVPELNQHVPPIDTARCVHMISRQHRTVIENVIGCLFDTTAFTSPSSC